jgi:hypothetical protein
LVHIKYKGARLVDVNELNILSNEFMNKRSSTVKLLRLVSEVYMDLTFPASTDDVTFILKEYNVLPLFLYIEIKDSYIENNLYQSNKLSKMCVLNCKKFEKSIKNKNNLINDLLIIPIAWCDYSNHYISKLVQQVCITKTSIDTF